MSDFINDALEAAANQTQQTPTEKRSAMIKQLADQADQAALKGVVGFINGLNQGHDLLWNNPRGLHPQEICDYWGTTAAQRFSDHAAALTYLITSKPAAAKLLKQYDKDVWTVKANPDGSVTITETVPAPE